MKKTVLVTAGCTSEAIDGVRRITNSATGRLGSLIAEECIQQGMNVVYVCGEGAAQPISSTLSTIFIQGVLDLQKAMQQVANTYKIDAIVHSMAVSDYIVEGVTEYGVLKESILKNELKIPYKNTAKMSSDMEKPIIVLKKAPKVINGLKLLFPDAVLIGFKLLVDTSEENLRDVALTLLNKNKCDYVLANDMVNITETMHKAMLLNKDGIVAKFETKNEIAAGITNVLTTSRRAK